MILWVAALRGGPFPVTVSDPMAWHIHEMLFGFLGAVFAGFLLTAVPNWTGRLPVTGWPLIGLFGMWIVGRVAMLYTAVLPNTWVAALDLGLPVALVLFLAREILIGKNWRNLIVLGTLLVFLIGNLLFHLEVGRGEVALHGVGYRLGLAAAIMLIAIVGGRIVPSFTRNWLARVGKVQRPTPPMQRYDRVAVLALLSALLVWTISPASAWSSALLLIAGTAHLVRMARWQGHRTLEEPLVAVLHVAYLFLPLGAIAQAVFVVVGEEQLQLAALHIWTMGAIGTMSLGVMTRATLGHTGMELHAGAGTTALYLALPLSLCCRLIAVASSVPEVWFTLSAVLWSGCFLGFLALYGPLLLRRRRTAQDRQASSRNVRRAS